MKLFGLSSVSFDHDTSYNINADPSTQNAFGAAAYRFGHTLTGEFVGLFNLFQDVQGLEALEDHFFITRLICDRKSFGGQMVLVVG